MVFTICFKTQTGRPCRLNCIASSFEECLEKISSLYGDRLLSISFDVKKNREVRYNAVSGKNRA